jgi:hypothetical protein
MQVMRLGLGLSCGGWWEGVVSERERMGVGVGERVCERVRGWVRMRVRTEGTH